MPLGGNRTEHAGSLALFVATPDLKLDSSTRRGKRQAHCVAFRQVHRRGKGIARVLSLLRKLTRLRAGLGARKCKPRTTLIEPAKGVHLCFSARDERGRDEKAPENEKNLRRLMEG